MPYSLAGNMCIFLVTVIVLPGFLMAEIKIDHILRNSFSKTGYFSMCFLSIILFVMLGTGLIFVDFIYMSNPLTIFLFICVCILTFATYGIYVRIIQETHQKLEAQNQIHHIQTQLAATKEHYQWIIRMNEYSKKIQHDFRHHMVILNGFLEQEDYAQAFDYITQYIRSTTPFSYIHFCSNQVVDILLNHYRAQCNSQKIDFRVQSVPVNLAPPSGCEDIQSSDLSVIIGNLLENAMTAASKVPPTQAFIQIGICLKGNTLVIWVDNSFDGMINLKEGEYQSTKNDHAAIGLKSIRLLTEKYFGGTEFRHEERIFHASVMLQYPALDGSLS
ncbi:MAG: GHKL domain-containing protein [Eubacteriales bacterium]|nr:GHKL domain-containing protein [Eubacteriales bacterium]